MSIRDDLIPLIDEIRDEVVDETAGLRRYDVAIVVRTWASGVIGRGEADDVSTPIAPRPKVVDPAPRLRIAEPGRFEEGDRLVDKISATYTEDELRGGTLAAGEMSWWTIDGEPYQVVSVTERFLSWEVQLRKMRTRPPAA